MSKIIEFTGCSEERRKAESDHILRMKQIATDYLHNKTDAHTQECQHCKALMPQQAHFCYDCGNSMNRSAVSLERRILRNTILVMLPLYVIVISRQFIEVAWHLLG